MVENAQQLEVLIRLFTLFTALYGGFGTLYKGLLAETSQGIEWEIGLVLIGSLGQALQYTNKRVKLTLVLLISEVLQSILYQKSKENPQQKMLYGTAAVIIMVKSQIPFLSHTFFKIGVCLKFLYFWCYHDLILSQSSTGQFELILIIFILSISVQKLQTQHFKISKKRYQKAQRTQAIINNIITSLRDGILVLSSQNQVLFSNPILPQLIGLGRRDLKDYLSTLEFQPKNKMVSNLENSNFLMDDLKICKDMIPGDHIPLGSMTIYQKQLDIQVNKVDWVDGSQGLIVIFRDTTYLTNVQKLETENNCKLELLRFASHELKTPTIAILGFIETTLMKQEDILSPKVIRKLKVIQASAYLLYYTISDIVDYSKIIADQLVLQKSYFSVKKWISHVQMMFAQQVKKAKLSFHTRIDSKLPEYIFSDHSKLTQILVIFLQNSLKYTFSGTIQIVALLTHQFRLKIIVSDTGIGIPQPRLRKIRRKLKRNKLKGTMKIGLQIASRLCSQLGTKKVSISSVPNKGTQIIAQFFIFEYPIFQDQNPQIQSLNEFQTSQNICSPFIPYFAEHVKLNSVLVVDDNDFNRIACIQLLKQMGISCVEAKDGIEAVQKVQNLSEKNKDVPVVIMDIDMPLMDGWKATRTIVELFEMKKISKLPKIIGYSAFSSYDDINKCYDCGMVSYLSKPASYLVLKSLMKNFVNVTQR